MGKLSEYGYNYHIQMLSALLKDKQYAAQLYDLYESDFFDNEAVKFLFDRYFEYFDKYKAIAPLSYFKAEISKQSSDSFKRELVEHLKKAWDQVDSVDLPYVKESSIESCKILDMKNALLQCTEYLNQGKLELVKQKIDQSLAKGYGDVTGYDYNYDVALRFHQEDVPRIPTPWTEINNITQGGLPAGNLGVIIAPTGVGKSWILSALGAHCIQQGYNVFHYSLELEDVYVGQRYDTIIHGIPTTSLPLHENKIVKASAQLPGRLRIFRYPTRRLSLTMIEAHLDKMALLGHKPDLIVIDYADILKVPQSFKRDDLALQAMYEELRGLAGERSVPIWTASQTNRTGASADIVEGTDVSDSYGKIMTADLVLTVSRKSDDVLNNAATMFVDKSRLGPDKIAFPMKFNTSIGQFDVLPKISSMIEQSKQKQTQRKEYLKNIYDQLNASGSSDNLF